MEYKKMRNTNTSKVKKSFLMNGRRGYSAKVRGQKYRLEVFEGIESKEKYNSKKIHSLLIKQFMYSLLILAEKTRCHKVIEMGCGEGQICGILHKNGYHVKGFDISEESIRIAKSNFMKISGGKMIEVEQKNIYDVVSEKYPLVICCEVLEHLENPEKALNIISDTAEKYFIVSVPREPMWCILNMLRGKYLRYFGNTPGHINHWSKKEFIRLVAHYGEIIDVKTPLPWTMILCKKKTK